MKKITGLLLVAIFVNTLVVLGQEKETVKPEHLTVESFKERVKNFPLMPSLEDIKYKELGWSPYVNTK